MRITSGTGGAVPVSTMPRSMPRAEEKVSVSRYAASTSSWRVIAKKSYFSL